MGTPIVQSPYDKVTYQFTVGGLGARTLSTVNLTADDLTLSNIVNDTNSFNVTVDSTNVSGTTTIDAVFNLSNGDVENKCIRFTIGKQCVN